MSHEKLIGWPVIGPGEGFQRKVIEVSGDRARCQRFAPYTDDVKWFAIADLKHEDGRPLRATF